MNNTDIRLAEETIAPLRKLYRDHEMKPDLIIMPVGRVFDGICDAIGFAEDVSKPADKRKMYTRYLVTNAFGFGFGATIVEAKKNCRHQNPTRLSRIERAELIYRAKLVTQETTCDSAGGISYFPTFPPIELGEV